MMRDKRGAEGILWAAGVAILLFLFIALVAYFLIDIAGDAGTVIDTFPSALSAKAEICKRATSSGVAFCEFTPIDLKEIKGDLYINCDYPGESFKQEMDALVDKPKCPTDWTVTYCKTLKDSDPNFKVATINDYLCEAEEEKTCGEAEGEWEEEATACASGVVDYTDFALDKDNYPNQRCCIAESIA